MSRTSPGPSALLPALTVAWLLVVSLVVVPPVAAGSACRYCVVGTIQVGYGADAVQPGIAYDSSDADLFVSDSAYGAWGDTEINGSSDQVLGSLSTGPQPLGVAFDPRTGDVYLANLAASLSVVNGSTDRWMGTISLPAQAAIFGGAWSVIYDPVTGNLVVLLTSPALLVIVDPASEDVVAEVPASGWANVMAADPISGQVFVENTSSGQNYSFGLDALNGSTGALESSIVVNGTASAMAFDPATGDLYIADVPDSTDAASTNGTLVEVNPDGPSVMGSWPVGVEPSGVAVDPVSGDVFVVNQGSANVSVRNLTTGRFVTSIPFSAESSTVGPDPTVFDSENDCVYFVQLEGLVSILSPPDGTCASPLGPAVSPVVVELLAASTLTGLAVAAGVYVYLGRRPARGRGPR